MKLEMKIKELSPKQITKMFLEYEERFEAITTTLETMMKQQPDYSGAQILNIFTEENQITFYMVTDFCIEDHHINFYHLTSVDNESFKYSSFDPKPPKMKTGAYIKKLERDPRWNRTFEQFFIPSVLRTQFVGKFTYSKYMDLEDNEVKLIMPKGDVLNFPSKDN